jgi:hypothetical protein
MPEPCKWSLYFRFPNQNPVWIYLLPHTFYMPTRIISCVVIWLGTSSNSK